MKIETPLHTDHQLDQLAGQFEHWRWTRSHPSERIPQRLWKQAAALALCCPTVGWRSTCGYRPVTSKNIWPHRATRGRPRPHDLSKCRLHLPGPQRRRP